MASILTSSFSFTNTTEGATVPTTALGLSTNYAKTMDEPTEARITNKTAALDQAELITYRSREIPKVSTDLQVLYPARVLNGVEFGVRIDELYRTTDEQSGLIICDEPIVATLTIRCPKSSNMSDEVIDEVVSRLLGSVYDQTAKAYRWGDLMRSSLIPMND